ncbi:MAG: hypothetical protein ACLGHR_10310 [Gammaproteobacteria bacterium]
MAATVQIIEKTGAGGTATDKTSGTIRFKNADNATVDTGNPMVKPASGTDYSFEKWLRFNVTGGAYTEITNIKAYSDGANGLGTGIGLYAKAVTAYATPAEATATTGYTDFFTYTSGSALSLGAGPFTSTGEKGDHLVMMMTVADTASGGVTASETLTIAWDEI